MNADVLMHPLELGYDLKGPCSDCPFRNDVPIHEGIATGLVGLIHNMEQGRAMHSCHKTDPRADGYREGYQGEIQHCGGFMVMQARNDGEYEQVALLRGRLAKATKLSSYPDDPRVFTPAGMIRAYQRWARIRVDRRDLAREVARAEGEGWPSQ